jgi:hypothetical protein
MFGLAKIAGMLCQRMTSPYVMVKGCEIQATAMASGHIQK